MVSNILSLFHKPSAPALPPQKAPDSKSKIAGCAIGAVALGATTYAIWRWNAVKVSGSPTPPPKPTAVAAEKLPPAPPKQPEPSSPEHHSRNPSPVNPRPASPPVPPFPTKGNDSIAQHRKMKGSTPPRSPSPAPTGTPPRPSTPEGAASAGSTSVAKVPPSKNDDTQE